MQHAKSVLVRDARGDEQAAIHRLTLAVYEDYATLMTPFAWSGLRSAVLAALATTVSAERIVAEQGGELIGSVMLFPAAVDAYGSLSAQSAVPELRLLAVNSAARRQGVGRILVEECIRRARLSGAPELGLHTSKSMQAAIHLYETLGFVRFPPDDFQPQGAELITAYRLRLVAD